MKKVKTIILIFIIITILLIFVSFKTNGNKNRNDKIIGTINGKEISVLYYDDIFNESNIYGEQTEKVRLNSVEKTILSNAFKETGNDFFDKKQLNTQINLLKSQHGEKYFDESSKSLNLPIKNIEDLKEAVNFKINYNEFISNKANITLEQMSKCYYENYKTLYCATHILTEKEEDALALLKKINNKEKKFEDYVQEGKQSQKIKEEQSKDEKQKSKDLYISDFILSDIPVKEFSDLGCKPSNNFTNEFKVALERMNKGELTTTPVKTEFGYHIIKMNDIIRKDLDSKLQKQIKNRLVNEKTHDIKVKNQYIKDLINSVQVNITDEKFKQYFDKYMLSLDNTVSEDSN